MCMTRFRTDTHKPICVGGLLESLANPTAERTCEPERIGRVLARMTSESKGQDMATAKETGRTDEVCAWAICPKCGQECCYRNNRKDIWYACDECPPQRAHPRFQRMVQFLHKFKGRVLGPLALLEGRKNRIGHFAPPCHILHMNLETWTCRYPTATQGPLNAKL